MMLFGPFLWIAARGRMVLILVFFKSYWHIVSRDVIEAVVDFFSGGFLPRFYTASYLVLIPKVENPSSFDKFRPISLCSVIYKNHSVWRVKQGDLSFWWDHWVGEGPLCDEFQVMELPSLKLVDCKLVDGWNIELFQRLVGIEKTDVLLEKLGNVKVGDDVLIWLPNGDGKFSTRSAWECI
ncbi:hypothetical protein F2P56_032827, partial [Juglans regia]